MWRDLGRPNRFNRKVLIKLWLKYNPICRRINLARLKIILADQAGGTAFQFSDSVRRDKTKTW